MGTISFARGVPAPECLPVAEFADCAREVIERDGETILNYGPVGGYGPLRDWLAERHGVEPGRVLVTNGSLPGLNLVLDHFAPQARILVEAHAPVRVVLEHPQVVPARQLDEAAPPLERQRAAARVLERRQHVQERR